MKRQCPFASESYCSAGEYTLFGTSPGEFETVIESERTLKTDEASSNTVLRMCIFTGGRQQLESLFTGAVNETDVWHSLGYPAPEEMWKKYPSETVSTGNAFQEQTVNNLCQTSDLSPTLRMPAIIDSTRQEPVHASGRPRVAR